MKKISHFSHSEYAPLAVLIIFNLIIGALTLSHYGESWDEFNYYFHARQSLSAYTRLFTTPGEAVIYDPTYRFYGPSFVMLIVLVSKLFPDAILSDVAHGLSFLVFQIGLILLYLLARRWFRPYAAFGATLLFASQPLLWGHAFINPKDTSFMVCFLACIYFGINMVDSYPLPSSKPLQMTSLNGALAQDWQRVKPSIRIWLAVLTILTVVMAGLLVAVVFRLRETYFPPSFYDPNTVDLERYLYDILTRAWQVLLFIFLFLTGLSLFFLPYLPATRSTIWEQELRPLGKQVRSYFQLRPLILASIVLGFSTSIRFLALAAGGFVAFYTLWKHGRTSLVYLVTYLGVSLLIMVLSWPYLWGAPVFRFLLTILVMLRFPWPGEVLFNGDYYLPDALPGDYLPKIISLQLTEPTLVLALSGFILTGVANFRNMRLSRRLNISGLRTDLFYWVIVWFLMPLAGAILSRPSLYDNFRQLHFILPPLFLMAGLALDFFAERVNFLTGRLAVLGLVALPGVLGIQRMFPYEYTYYNAMVGQPFRRFEMDYWGTSFREAAGYLNANVPEGGAVKVWGPVTSLWPYLRKDIQAIRSEENIPRGNYYALILTRNEMDLRVYPDFPDVFTVERAGALLAVVRKIP